MKVYLNTTPEFKTAFLAHCEEEQESGYYSHNPHKVTPLEQDFLPSWASRDKITKGSFGTTDGGEDTMVGKTTVYAGGSFFPEGVLYCSCAGNWLSLSHKGEVRVGGRRHGMPYITKDDVVDWQYPVGGTLTPAISPFDHPKQGDHAKLSAIAQKKAVEKVLEGLAPDLKETVVKTEKLKGYRLERAKSFLKVMLKGSEYTTLYPN